jgi:hypothetical protein
MTTVHVRSVGSSLSSVWAQERSTNHRARLIAREAKTAVAGVGCGTRGGHHATPLASIGVHEQKALCPPITKVYLGTKIAAPAVYWLA